MVGSPWLVVVSAGWSECPSKVQAMIDTVQADRTSVLWVVCRWAICVVSSARARGERGREREGSDRNGVTLCNPGQWIRQ
jgi:hypothetical protein